LYSAFPLIAASTSLVLGEDVDDSETLGASETLGDSETLGASEAFGDAEGLAEVEVATRGVDDVTVAVGCWHEATASAMVIGSEAHLARYLSIFAKYMMKVTELERRGLYKR
jgi:hypothetical protein